MVGSGRQARVRLDALGQRRGLDHVFRAAHSALIQGYKDARDELATTGRALPGSCDTLATLSENPVVFQTVLRLVELSGAGRRT
jgi:hypothetical protein